MILSCFFLSHLSVFFSCDKMLRNLSSRILWCVFFHANISKYISFASNHAFFCLDDLLKAELAIIQFNSIVSLEMEKKQRLPMSFGSHYGLS